MQGWHLVQCRTLAEYAQGPGFYLRTKGEGKLTYYLKYKAILGEAPLKTK